MKDIRRLLFNLGVSYMLMNREQFTERFTALFEKYQWDEEKLAQLSDAIMHELENWRMRKNMEDVMADAQQSGNEDLKSEIRDLVEEIRRLNEELKKKEGGKE